MAKVKSSYTLEVLKDRNKYVLCVIKVAERGIKYYSGQDQLHFTNRWLRPEHWAAFDSKLRELIAGDELKSLNGPLDFKLIDSVSLQVAKSTIPTDLLCRTVTDIEIPPNEIIAAIECRLEYFESSPHLENVTLRRGKSYKENVTPKKEEQSHRHSSSRSSQRNDANLKEDRKHNNRKEHETPQKDKHHIREETSAKKKSFEENETPRKEDTQPTEESPPKEKSFKENKTPQKDETQYRHESLSKKNQRHEKVTPVKDQSLHSHENQRKENQSQEKRNTRNSANKIADLDRCEILIDSEDDESDPLDSVVRTTREPKKSSLKRSRRSPVKVDNRLKTPFDTAKDCNRVGKKLKRTNTGSSSDSDILDEENLKKATAILNGNNKLKNSNRMSQRKTALPISIEKHGTSKDSDMCTTKSSSSSSKLSSKKTKTCSRKPNSQESRSMNNWLGKKSSAVSTERSKEHIKSENNTSLIDTGEDVAIFKVPSYGSQSSSQEEREEQIESAKARTDYNRKVTEIIKELTPKSPEKIKILDLTSLTTRGILNTFTKYQSKLDDLFEEFKGKSKPKRSNGVDHFFIMGLLSNETQFQMMNTLSECYEKNKEGIPKYGELFSMVLMPEWVLNIFMEHYDKSREEAIEYIKAQNNYKVYKHDELQIDDTLML